MFFFSSKKSAVFSARPRLISEQTEKHIRQHLNSSYKRNVFFKCLSECLIKILLSVRLATAVKKFSMFVFLAERTNSRPARQIVQYLLS